MTGVLLIAAAIAVAAWVERRIHPMRRCPSCTTRKGRNWGSDSRTWGTCRRCNGKGEIRRFGAGGER